MHEATLPTKPRAPRYRYGGLLRRARTELSPKSLQKPGRLASTREHSRALPFHQKPEESPTLSDEKRATSPCCEMPTMRVQVPSRALARGSGPWAMRGSPPVGKHPVLAAGSVRYAHDPRRATAGPGGGTAPRGQAMLSGCGRRRFRQSPDGPRQGQPVTPRQGTTRIMGRARRAASPGAPSRR